jgi:hypothetical protein
MRELLEFSWIIGFKKLRGIVQLSVSGLIIVSSKAKPCDERAIRAAKSEAEGRRLRGADRALPV